jgi:hypothetical protein
MRPRAQEGQDRPSRPKLYRRKTPQGLGGRHAHPHEHLPEIQLLSRLMFPQPCENPLLPLGNDCEAWNPHGGMPLPCGMPPPA